MIVIEAAAAAF